MQDFFAFLPRLIDAIMRRFYPQQIDSSSAPFNHVPDASVRPATPPMTPLSNVTATPVSSPPSASGAKPDMLIIFCKAIRDNEGLPGNLNYKNNNPGNVRCSPVGYAPMYGNVRCVNNFSVFPTYELGWLYLQNLVHFRAMKHPNWTILDFFQGVLQPDGTYVGGYAPSADKNDPARYASFVAKRCGVPVNTTLQKLFA